MICEHANQVHIKSFGRSSNNLGIIEGHAISIVTTPCNFGGVRYWFQCPSCGRRCAILYPLACRICCDGRYASELLSPHDRSINTAIRKRQRLGQLSGGTLAPIPKKPKFMRWHTYLRLRAECEALETQLRTKEFQRFSKLKIEIESKRCEDPMVPPLVVI